MMSQPDTLYYYTLYGLAIATTRSLPNAAALMIPPEQVAQVDVRVELVGTHPYDPTELELSALDLGKCDACAQEAVGFFLWKSTDGNRAYWRLRSSDGEHTIDFVVTEDGTRVWGFWSSDDLVQEATSMLLGAVLGHILQLQGQVFLHASIVAYQGTAIALLSESGAEKSLAVALNHRGFKTLVQDLVPIRWVDDQIWIQSGYPAFQLWSLALAALQDPLCELPCASHHWEQRWLPPNLSTAPQPLRAIYLLGQRDSTLTEASLETLTPVESLQQLLTYHYGRQLLTRSQQQQNFQRLAEIAKILPIRKIHCPDHGQRWDQMCAAIIQDLAKPLSVVQPRSPRVTWLIPVKNGMPYITETLASIAAQTYKNWEVLIWDNGSTDGTQAELEQWVPERLPGRVVRDQPIALGRSLANMVERCGTELCARIDADDVNAPERLEYQVAYLAAHPEVSVLASCMHTIDRNGAIKNACISPLSHEDIVHWMMYANPIAHPSIMFRRTAILEIGNYRELTAVEDYDLWLRAAATHKLAKLNLPLIYYRSHDKNTTRKYAYSIDDRSNECWIHNAPRLYGCTTQDARLLREKRHPNALPSLYQIAVYLSKTQGGEFFDRLYSDSFIRSSQQLLSPDDHVSQRAFQTLSQTLYLLQAGQSQKYPRFREQTHRLKNYI
jgi:glycosyltransferase involved in cell wall biosynthesis